MPNVRKIRRALPVAMVATTALASVGAIVGVGTTVWGSGLRSSRPFIPVLSPPLPEFIQRFYRETSGQWPADPSDPVANASRPMELLAEHTLTFNAADENELANVMLAVNNMNGAIVMPGEVFSYNAVVGERTEERGFRPGLMYEAGKLVTGVGGGVCIPSTALYIAALNADMEIVERYNHSGPVSYAEPGLDAAVVFGMKDFRFRNTDTEPVTIEARVEGDVLTVRLRGNKAAGRRVVVETTDFGRLGFTDETVMDPEIPEGTPEVEQEGRSGFVVTVVRTVFAGEKVVRRETVSRDVVAPRNRITRMNPLDDPTTPEALAKAASEQEMIKAAEAETTAEAENAAEDVSAVKTEAVPASPEPKVPAAIIKPAAPAQASSPPAAKAGKPPVVKPEKARTEPVRPEPVKPEPVKPEPVRIEAPKPEPTPPPAVVIEPPTPAPSTIPDSAAD